VIDVRVDSDSPNLLVVRQKVAVADGHIQTVGAPRESKLPLVIRRLRLEVLSSSSSVGASLVAVVTNDGTIPVAVTTVKFECEEPLRFPDGTTLDKSPGDAAWSFTFRPKDRIQLDAPLLPGEERRWYLPIDFPDGTLRAIGEVPPTKYRVTAYAGRQPVASVKGDKVRPHLESAEPFSGPVMTTQVRNTLASMDPPTREKIDTAFSKLSALEPEKWLDLPEVHRVDDQLFFLSIPPDYRLLLRRDKRGRFALLDLLRHADSGPSATSG
jgi:hypothetical protein